MPERYWNRCSWLLWAPCCHPGCNIFPRQVKEKGAKAVYQSVAVLLCQPFSRVKGMAVLLLTPWALGTQTLQAHLSCFHDFCSIFSFSYFFSQEITGYSGKLEGRGWIRIAMCWSWWLIFLESLPFNCWYKSVHARETPLLVE